ncbi:MAG TPA: CAP domain-containing protein [Anaerolineae bacterium]|nr:CAP domain-containing protein [Anaerolineae bacterium]HOQ97702.1 CAP domain-containing protein [Anaerolineae bacterium]HPL26850.1 CAP domain-containing protein [Anaerolineae bacterium]
MGPLVLTPEDRRAAGEMLQLVNASRREQGLRPLLLNERLCQVAKGHANDMRRRGYQAHESPEGVGVDQRVSRAGVSWHAVGENIAGGPTRRQGNVTKTGYPSLAAVHRGLLSSPGHRANILGDYDEMGVGLASNRDGTLIVVEVFIKR